MGWGWGDGERGRTSNHYHGTIARDVLLVDYTHSVVPDVQPNLHKEVQEDIQE